METLHPPSPAPIARHSSKIDRMDARVSKMADGLDGHAVCRLVHEVFGIDYRKVPVLEKGIGRLVKASSNPSFAAIDHWMALYGAPQDGPGIRKMMNYLFGTNLEGIAALSRTRISLFSKGQWIARKEGDLFEIHTGYEDVDVKVIPSAFFSAQTGLQKLPAALEQALAVTGYTYNKRIGAFYYCNPAGKSVPDSFKHQTVHTIIAVTNEFFPQL